MNKICSDVILLSFFFLLKMYMAMKIFKISDSCHHFLIWGWHIFELRQEAFKGFTLKVISIGLSLSGSNFIFIKTVLWYVHVAECMGRYSKHETQFQIT